MALTDLNKTGKLFKLVFTKTSAYLKIVDGAMFSNFMIKFVQILRLEFTQKLMAHGHFKKKFAGQTKTLGENFIIFLGQIIKI